MKTVENHQIHLLRYEGIHSHSYFFPHYIYRNEHYSHKTTFLITPYPSIEMPQVLIQVAQDNYMAFNIWKETIIYYNLVPSTSL